MNVISIGDIHGRPYWKNIDPESFDLIVFIGDYVDAYIFSNGEVLQNLKDIIVLKKKYPEKVVLLLGNHDVQYMWNYFEFGCTGFRDTMYDELHILFTENRDLFKIAHQEGKTIWTHAGISNGWVKFNQKIIDENAKKFGTEALVDTLNCIMHTKDNKILHQVSVKRQGVYPHGGITWADRQETVNNYLDGYHQIVGHTPIDRITKFGDENGSIRYIDVQRNADKDGAEAYRLDDLFYFSEL